MKEEWVYRMGKEYTGEIIDAFEGLRLWQKCCLFMLFPRYYLVSKEFIDLIDSSGNIRRIYPKEKSK